MALDAFGLFVHQSQQTTGELQIKVYQIIFDILMLYGLDFLQEKGEAYAVRLPHSLHHLLNVALRSHPKSSSSCDTHSVPTRRPSKLLSA